MKIKLELCQTRGQTTNVDHFWIVCGTNMAETALADRNLARVDADPILFRLQVHFSG